MSDPTDRPMSFLQLQTPATPTLRVPYPPSAQTNHVQRASMWMDDSEKDSSVESGGSIGRASASMIPPAATPVDADGFPEVVPLAPPPRKSSRGAKWGTHVSSRGGGGGVNGNGTAGVAANGALAEDGGLIPPSPPPSDLASEASELEEEEEEEKRKPLAHNISLLSLGVGHVRNNNNSTSTKAHSLSVPSPVSSKHGSAVSLGVMSI